MPVRPTSHLSWQLLRTLKRSPSPLTGRALRLIPSRKIKDGAFLNELVGDGLLIRVSGSAGAPFQATYALTDKGLYAAEYGEYEYEMKPRVATADSASVRKSKVARTAKTGRKTQAPRMAR